MTDHQPSGSIKRYEVAPTTDAEWEEALRYYGNDRLREHWVNQSPVTQPSQTSPSAADHAELPGSETNQPLIHHERGADVDGAHCPETRHHNHRQFSIAAPFHVLDGTAADDNGGHHGTNWVWPLTRTAASVDIIGASKAEAAAKGAARRADAKEANAERAPFVTDPQQYDMEAFGLPRTVNPDEDEGHLSAEAERRRVRAFYEREGYLPAPNPSKCTRVRRMRAIRRLGLIGDDDEERYAVIAKYIELAQMIFQTSECAVTIIRGNSEDVYGVGTQHRMFSFDLDKSLTGHAAVYPGEKCFVVADIQTDWRFGKNPSLNDGCNHKFVAAAPLRYHRCGDDFIDFGTLVITDIHERSTFDEREQSILQRLANMLVFQLATLQSEIMAKQSSNMYETSINFLRRSIVPDEVRDPKADDRPQAKPDTTKRSGNGKSKTRLDTKRPDATPANANAQLSQPRPAAIPMHIARPNAARKSAHHSGSPGPTPSRSPKPGQLATKAAPREARGMKRRDKLSSMNLFSDAAATLRGILKADAVSLVDFRGYQLFVRKSEGNEMSGHYSKESVVSDFLQGKEWPKGIEPVVNYAKRPGDPEDGLAILGQSCTPGFEFNLEQPGATDTMARFVKTYLQKRHFWWDREDPDDEMAKELMVLMPSQSKTVLAVVHISFQGTVKYATFVTWERPPSAFDDSSRLALPFIWIIGAALVSGLAIARMRNVEESQIKYSNLQAHELRTPLHQILAITQLLRSSMSDLAETGTVQMAGSSNANGNSITTTLEQVRDLLPFLDAIDTSGKTLDRVTSNIITFLDLEAYNNKTVEPHTESLGFNNGRGTPTRPLGTMLEELVIEAHDEERQARLGLGQTVEHVETVISIIPPDLGELVTEDRGGALRRAIGRLIRNAYRYIECHGCVEITVDDVEHMLPPAGCEGLSKSRRISITIADNGRGMSVDFVREKLGEPWAKEDVFATGSGLSVHLAYRIIDLMDGTMEISSAPNQGTTVKIEVPLPVAPHPIMAPPMTPRKVGLLGFDGQNGFSAQCHLANQSVSLTRRITQLGSQVVPLDEADLVLVDGACQNAADKLGDLSAADVVVFCCLTADHNVEMGPLAPHQQLRRLAKPVTPSLIREALAPGRSPETASPPASASPLRLHFDSARLPRRANTDSSDGLPWKPRGICAEEAVAALSMGDYFSSRARVNRAASSGSAASSTTGPLGTESSYQTEAPTVSTPPTAPESPRFGPLYVHGPSALPGSPLDDKALHNHIEDADTPPTPKILVVEDNGLNRKLLVRMIRTAFPKLEIIEAEDGVQAVEHFGELSHPAVVLLDINMPRMDGYAAAMEMRRIEAQRNANATGDHAQQLRSKIIAVTALSGDEEKRRGMIESGIDAWLTKPCPKTTLQKAVDEAWGEITGGVLAARASHAKVCPGCAGH